MMVVLQFVNFKNTLWKFLDHQELQLDILWAMKRRFYTLAKMFLQLWFHKRKMKVLEVQRSFASKLC